MASSLMTPGVRSPALVGRLGTVAWVVLCLSAVIGFAVEGTSAGDLEESLLFVTSALFFALMVARPSTVLHTPGAVSPSSGAVRRIRWGLAVLTTRRTRTGSTGSRRTGVS